MADHFYASRPAPLDQADGLRRLFAAARVRHVAVVGNAQVPFAGVLLERLTEALAALGRHTLVVDAAAGSPPAHELARVDLGACLEPLAPGVSYLAASRLFLRRPLRPVLLAADAPAALTEAYAGFKLLALRNGWLSFDVLLAADAHLPRSERIVNQLASCADRFLGAALHDWALLDPADDTAVPLGGALLRVAAALLEPADETPPVPAPPRHVPAPRAPAWI